MTLFNKNIYDGGMTDKTEMKIFILFLMDELNYPLDYTALSFIIGESGYVGRFDFTACFSELIELGHVESFEEKKKTYYVVSELGHMVATELQSTLLDSIREKSRIGALRLLSLHKKGAKCHCRIKRRKDGIYEVHCRIEDKKGVISDVTVTTSTESEAQHIKAHFKEKPEEVCRGVLAVMTGKVDYYLH
ncbi:MAG: DUF4364 family protein [Clostridia bacterium]|nr:DUF4364 family protein [Clostridia bacterium]